MTKRDIIHSPCRMYIIRGRWYIAYMYMYHNWYVVIRLQHLRINEVFFLMFSISKEDTCIYHLNSELVRINAFDSLSVSFQMLHFQKVK